jgi:hypothetical protein
MTAQENQMSQENSDGMLNAASEDANNEVEMAKRGGKSRYRRW